VAFRIVGHAEQLAANAPAAGDAASIRRWFDGLMDEAIPDADGTLATARRTADVLARRAKAGNTRRAYRSAVRAWCARHHLPALPAAPADIAGFLSEERYPPAPAKPSAMNTVKLRAAAIRYLHCLANLPSPTSTAEVTETLAGITREAGKNGDGPRPKLAARVAILGEIVTATGDDLRGLRDRALLLVGFAGAFRRADLAAIATVAGARRCCRRLAAGRHLAGPHRGRFPDRNTMGECRAA
jgi:hypothetical protein